MGQEMSIQFREKLNGKGTVQDVVDLLIPIAPQARITGGMALQAAAGAGPDMGNMGGQAQGADPNVVDADYEVVDDNK